MASLRWVHSVGVPGAFEVHRSAPLQHVSVRGVLRDTVAEYTIEQTYVNPLHDATIAAAYTFPLYEGVAVSAFEAEVDGRRVVGRVQEREAARREFQEAVKAGHVASLLEQERPDVFQASIGNIPPAKTIVIRITLVSETKHDADQNQVRLVLPTTIAPRYGSVDDFFSTAKSSNSKLSVEISCAMATSITSIQSPSHTIQVHLGLTMVSLTADSLLDRDLVIIVQALGLDSPRAVVERHPTDGTHAMSLTFSPRFALKPLKSSEFVFIVDRSGSMGGSKIEQAGKALELFLRSIPFDDHYIQIVGFGDTPRALFPKSVDYSADSLKRSTKYAKALSADMGGTEITRAVQEAFRCRRRDVPTQVFLLTDGEVWDVDTLIQCIEDAVVEGEKTDAFVRVFILGIGASVSHHLIESVARAGGGYAQLVVEGERMEKKVVNMLKAALLPPVTNVGIQWTPEGSHDEDDFEMAEAPQPAKDTTTEPISLFSTAPEIPSPSPRSPSVLPDVVTPIQQAPFKVPALFSGARFTIYAILSPETTVPKELVLRGSSPDGPVELKVEVKSTEEGKTMLHSLAARALVRDLEEGVSFIHALTEGSSRQMPNNLGIYMLKEGKKYRILPVSDKVVSQLAKQKIVNLALSYRLSSKYTSWVAIDTECNRTIIHDNVRMETYDEAAGLYRGGLAHRPCKRVVRRTSLSSPVSSGASLGGQYQSSRLCRKQNKNPAGPQRCSMRQISSSAGQQRSLCSLSYIRREAIELPPSSLPVMLCTLKESEDSDHEEEFKESSDAHTRLYSLLRHQQFDGSFPLVPEIAALFSTTVKELRCKLAQEVHKLDDGVQLSEAEWESVWATCLAVEFLKQQLPGLHEEWELVVEKAQKRVAAMVKSTVGVASIQQGARECINTITGRTKCDTDYNSMAFHTFI